MPMAAMRGPLVRAYRGAEVEAVGGDDLGAAWELALCEARVSGVGVDDCEGGCCEGGGEGEEGFVDGCVRGRGWGGGGGCHCLDILLTEVGHCLGQGMHESYQLID
jgi:hypothetical protein